MCRFSFAYKPRFTNQEQNDDDTQIYIYLRFMFLSHLLMDGEFPKPRDIIFTVQPHSIILPHFIFASSPGPENETRQSMPEMHVPGETTISCPSSDMSTNCITTFGIPNAPAFRRIV